MQLVVINGSHAGRSAAPAARELRADVDVTVQARDVAGDGGQS